MIQISGKQQSDTIKLEKDLRVTGTGSIEANVLKVMGNVRIVNQFAVITSITTLINATAVYAVEWDGTLAKDLTKNTGVLSGVPVGTLFLKDKVTTEPYSIMSAAEGQVNEVVDTKKVGKAFTITQKNGVDTFIQLRLTTTDTPIDFTAHVTFEYIPLNGNSMMCFL